MEVNLDTVMFQVVTPDGHLYKLYLDGKVEGFPSGSTVMNKALPLFYAMQGQCMKRG